MKTIQRMTKSAFGRVMAFMAAFVMTVTMTGVSSFAADFAMEAKNAGDVIATVGDATFVALQKLTVTPYDAGKEVTINGITYDKSLKSSGVNNVKVDSSTARAYGVLTATKDTSVKVLVAVGTGKAAYIFKSATDLNVPGDTSNQYRFAAADAYMKLPEGGNEITFTVEAGSYYYIAGVGTNLEVFGVSLGDGSTSGGEKPTTPEPEDPKPSTPGVKIATSGSIDSYFTLNGKAADDPNNSAKSYSIDGTVAKSTGRIKLNGKGVESSISFTTTSTAKVEVWAISSDKATDSQIALFGTDGNAIKTADAYATQSKKIDTTVEYGKADNPILITIEADSLAAGTYTIAAPSDAPYAVNVYYVRVTEDTGSNPGTEDPGKEEPGTEDPGKEEPGTEDPGKEDPKPENDGWVTEDGVKYWYEDGVKQGTEGRGKEIYDSASDAWYWLDAPDGKVAVSKDVYQESDAGEFGDKIDENGNRVGKWVRYDADGHMIKGWCAGTGKDAVAISSPKEAATGADVYYFDPVFGAMVKGYYTIEGTEYFFNVATGVLEKTVEGVKDLTGWKNVDGVDIWYENGVRQGVSKDASYRGKEIFDPGTNAWYWLDNVDGGKKAVSKDVYQESLAGDWGDTTNEAGEKIGKWVRYDAQGHMIKGWCVGKDADAKAISSPSEAAGADVYYFDPVFGTMAKGVATIDGVQYTFDTATGILTK